MTLYRLLHHIPPTPFLPLLLLLLLLLLPHATHALDEHLQLNPLVAGGRNRPSCNVHEFPCAAPSDQCVARREAPAAQVEGAIGWACSPGGGKVDCSGVADLPGDLYDHASWVFDQYYQRIGEPFACQFQGPGDPEPSAELVTGVPREMDPYPPAPFPCPCPAYGSPGAGADAEPGDSAVPGAAGAGTQPNPDAAMFDSRQLYGGFDDPVDMAFVGADLLFVLERGGVVWRVDRGVPGGGEPRVWLDMSAEVATGGDRGAMSLASRDGSEVLLLYTAGGPALSPFEPALQRLVAVPDRNGSGAWDERRTLLGADAVSSPPTCYSSHGVGAVRFGLDGSVLVTSGDGARYDLTGDVYGGGDFGQDEACTPLYGADQDNGNMRAQMRGSLAGKVLRLDATTGRGVCGADEAVRNPFCGSGDERAERVWALGFRQPWRLGVRETDEYYDGGPGALLVSETGWGSYEEVNLVTEGGQNFGWPCWEGPRPLPPLRDRSDAQYDASLNTANVTCAEVYADRRTRLPFFYWSRYTEGQPGFLGEQHYLGQGLTGNCAAGVAAYPRGGGGGSSPYPEWYDGAVLFLDFGAHWIRAARPRGGSGPDRDDFGGELRDFVVGDPAPIVTLDVDPRTGSVVYLRHLGGGAGSVREVRYLGAGVNAPPQAHAHARELPGGLVELSADGTTDREGAPLFFQWFFGAEAVATGPSPPPLVAPAAGAEVRLRVSDGEHAATHAAALPPPAAAGPLAAAVAGPPLLRYDPGDADAAVLLSATASGGRAPHAFEWELELVHNNHVHPEQQTAAGATFLVRPGAAADGHAGDRHSLRAVVTVRDADGRAATAAVVLVRDGAASAPPVPALEVLGGAAAAGQPAHFSALGTLDADADAVSYRWSFGDGTAGAQGVAVTHAFAAPGVYAVSVTATDSWNEAATATASVAVGPAAPPPTPAAEALGGPALRLTLEPYYEGGAAPPGLALWFAAGAAGPWPHPGGDLAVDVTALLPEAAADPDLAELEVDAWAVDTATGTASAANATARLPLPPLDCQWRWGEWSSCAADGTQTRRAELLSPAARGGAPCPAGLGLQAAGDEPAEEQQYCGSTPPPDGAAEDSAVRAVVGVHTALLPGQGAAAVCEAAGGWPGCRALGVAEVPGRPGLGWATADFAADGFGGAPEHAAEMVRQMLTGGGSAPEWYSAHVGVSVATRAAMRCADGVYRDSCFEEGGAGDADDGAGGADDGDGDGDADGDTTAVEGVSPPRVDADAPAAAEGDQGGGTASDSTTLVAAASIAVLGLVVTAVAVSVLVRRACRDDRQVDPADKYAAELERASSVVGASRRYAAEARAESTVVSADSVSDAGSSVSAAVAASRGISLAAPGEVELGVSPPAPSPPSPPPRPRKALRAAGGRAVPRAPARRG